MQRSIDRFLTTHVGSLPRPAELVRTMHAKEEGVPVDADALRDMARSAVHEVVARQLATGIDVVGDGEMSKPSYATYPKDRLSGFGGETGSYSYADLIEYPALSAAVFGDPGRSRRRSPACTGPIAPTDQHACQIDLHNVDDAVTVAVDAGAAAPAERFLTAASPGVMALFFGNEYYPSTEEFLFAIAEAMRPEYEAVVDAGFVLQLDCPDLGLGRHVQYAHLDVAEFREKARQQVAALNHATAGIDPERMRLHLCWGNYDGPHHRDIALADVIDIALSARPLGLSFEAANPRHAHEYTLFDDLSLPAGTVLIPGVIESTTNFVEHPELVAQRITRFAERVGRENVLAGTDCGFGTWVGQTAVDPGVTWAKLGALVQGARIASARFW